MKFFFVVVIIGSRANRQKEALAVLGEDDVEGGQHRACAEEDHEPSIGCVERRRLPIEGEQKEEHPLVEVLERIRHHVEMDARLRVRRLEGAQLTDLVASLERKFKRKLKPAVHVDPSLIGGVRVTVGDEVLDTSVRARLASMQTALTV